MSNLPACLRPALFERVAEGWSAEHVASWIYEKYGAQVVASDVLEALKQANAERGDVAKRVVRDHIRAELPSILAALTELRFRAKRYEAEAHAARDWAAVRAFMAEERNTIALALRYSGGANPDEPCAEAAAIVNAELEAMLDRLEDQFDRETFRRVLETLTAPAPRNGAGPTALASRTRIDLPKRM
jgi:hypothetical protein